MSASLAPLSIWTAWDLASCAIAFAITLVLLRSLMPLAHRIALVDRPSGVKIHKTSTPLVGGIAMFTAFALTMAILDIGLTPYRPLLVAGTMLVIIGILDDFKELTSSIRFAAQISAGLIMCYWGEIRLVDLGTLKFDGDMTRLGVWRAPLTVFCVVGVVNAINMADGLNGLAAGLAAIAFTALAYCAFTGGAFEHALVLALLSCTTLAFWLVNTGVLARHSEGVFMGDAGSLFLGFALAWFVIDLSQGNERVIAPAQALWMLFIPLMDTVRLLIWRAAQGRSPFKGDQEHLHHVLRRLGISARRSVGGILLIALAAAVVGVLAPVFGLSEFTLFYTFMGVFTAYGLLMAWIWLQQGALGRPLETHVGSDDRHQGQDRRHGDRRHGSDRRRCDSATLKRE